MYAKGQVLQQRKLLVSIAKEVSQSQSRPGDFKSAIYYKSEYKWFLRGRQQSWVSVTNPLASKNAPHTKPYTPCWAVRSSDSSATWSLTEGSIWRETRVAVSSPVSWGPVEVHPSNWLGIMTGKEIHSWPYSRQGLCFINWLDIWLRTSTVKWTSGITETR